MRPWLAAVVVALAALAAPASGGDGGSLADGVYRYPGDAGTLSLSSALLTPSIHTIVFERGEQPLSDPVYAFRRTGLTLCGATSDARDSTLLSSAAFAVVLDECRDIRIRNLTIRSTAAAGEGIRVQSVTGTEIEGYADDVTVRNCVVEAAIPVRARPRARNLTVTDCRLEVNRTNGFGLVWEDGPGLFVTRTRFATSPGTFSIAALFVRGASDATSEGDRAQRVHLTRNTVDGDFAVGFDLADVKDARVQRNTVKFPDPIHALGGGRVGLVVRRLAASALTEDWELLRNRVKGAHTGAWIVSAGQGAVLRNDLRGCGSKTADSQFADRGCALRINLQGPVCAFDVTRNDFRGLLSPKSDPACVVLPAGSEGVCFPAGSSNRVDGGRDVYEGAAKR